MLSTGNELQHDHPINIPLCLFCLRSTWTSRLPWKSSRVYRTTSWTLQQSRYVVCTRTLHRAQQTVGLVLTLELANQCFFTLVTFCSGMPMDRCDRAHYWSGIDAKKYGPYVDRSTMTPLCPLFLCFFPQFDDDFYEFRCSIKELERRLGAVVSLAFDDCATVYGRFKLLDSFEGLLERPIIQVRLSVGHHRR